MIYQRLLICIFAFFAFHAQAAKLPDFKGIGQTKTGSSVKLGPTGNVGTSSLPPPEWDSRIPVRNINIGGEWQPAGNYGAARDALKPSDAMLRANGEVFFPGTKYPFQAGYVVSPSLILNAVTALCSNPVLCVGLTVGTPYLLEWLRQSNVGINSDPLTNGAKPFVGSDPSVCSVGPCYAYENNYGKKFSSAKQACDDAAIRMGGADAVGTITGAIDDYSCSVSGPSGNYFGRSPIYMSPIAPVPSTGIPASMDDIAPYMDKPIGPRIFKELLDKGANIELPKPTITGPSSTEGEEVTTVNPDGSKTVSKTTYNFQTSGDTVTNTDKSTKTTTYNIDNSVRSVSTTTTVPSPSAPTDTPEKPDYSFNDSPFGDVPELYKRKYEDGIKGVWDQKMTAIKATPIFSLGRDIMPNLAATGSCPVFTVPLDLAVWAAHGNADVSPPCWVWDFGKVVIVCSALLLARRLIFGG